MRKSTNCPSPGRFIPACFQAQINTFMAWSTPNVACQPEVFALTIVFMCQPVPREPTAPRLRSCKGPVSSFSLPTAWASEQTMSSLANLHLRHHSRFISSPTVYPSPPISPESTAQTAKLPIKPMSAKRIPGGNEMRHSNIPRTPH